MIPQPFVRKAHVLPAPHLVLSREPLSKPLRRVRVDRRVGWGDLAQAEVLRPAGHHPVQRSDYLFRGFQPMTSFGLLADLAADALDARLARSIPDIGIAAVRAVIPSELVAEELHAFLLASQASGLLLVDCQLQPFHEPPDRGQHVSCRGHAEYTEVVGIRNNLRAEVPGKAQLLPTQDEASHVDVAQQR